MNFTKHVFPFVLIFALLFSFAGKFYPVAVYADFNAASVDIGRVIDLSTLQIGDYGDKWSYDGMTLSVDEDADIEITGTGVLFSIYTQNRASITLNNAHISTTGYGIMMYGQYLTITLVGNNTLQADGNNGIYISSQYTLEITGAGSLAVSGGETGISGGTVEIDGCTVTATGANAGIFGNLNMYNNAVLYASSLSLSDTSLTSGIIFTSNDAEIFGSFTLKENVTVGGTLTVSDGAALLIPNGFTLTAGQIVNNGTITNHGTINGDISGNGLTDGYTVILRLKDVYYDVGEVGIHADSAWDRGGNYAEIIANAGDDVRFFIEYDREHYGSIRWILNGNEVFPDPGNIHDYYINNLQEDIVMEIELFGLIVDNESELTLRNGTDVNIQGSVDSANGLMSIDIELLNLVLDEANGAGDALNNGADDFFDWLSANHIILSQSDTARLSSQLGTERNTAVGVDLNLAYTDGSGAEHQIIDLKDGEIILVFDIPPHLLSDETDIVFFGTHEYAPGLFELIEITPLIDINAGTVTVTLKKFSNYFLVGVPRTATVVETPPTGNENTPSRVQTEENTPSASSGRNTNRPVDNDVVLLSNETEITEIIPPPGTESVPVTPPPPPPLTETPPPPPVSEDNDTAAINESGASAATPSRVQRETPEAEPIFDDVPQIAESILTEDNTVADIVIDEVPSISTGGLILSETAATVETIESVETEKPLNLPLVAAAAAGTAIAGGGAMFGVRRIRKIK